MDTDAVYVAVLWRGKHTPIEVHKFRLEPEGKSQYRAAVSMNYLRDREARKLVGREPYAFRLRIADSEYFDALVEQDVRIMKPKPSLFGSLPMFEHDSIWAMYTAVGYDYKRKRFVRNLS